MRRRVAIIGGGVAGLTAAYELTRTAEARQRWEVTIVERGHKLGGRLASAHQPAAWGRNEEHGLHVWFGFYDNAFRLAEEVWRDAPRLPDCPWESVWDALRPITFSEHGLRDGESFTIRRMHHPRNAGRPGRDAERAPSARLTGYLDLFRTLPLSVLSVLGLKATASPKGEGVSKSLWPTPEADAAVRGLDEVLRPLFQRIRRLNTATSSDERVARAATMHRLVCRAQKPAVRAAGLLAGREPGARAFVGALDLVLAATRGLTSTEHGFAVDGDLDRLSAWELRAWLAHHGASAETLRESPLLEALYDMPFAFVGGDRERPVLETGTALRFTFRILANYKHAVVYLLRAGAGETLIAPLVDLLRERGVHFTFFHALERTELCGRDVGALHFRRGARVVGEYDPMIDRNGLRGFRSGPDWDQLVDGAKLGDRNVDFYSRFGDGGEADSVVWRRGVDYDDVILALPLGSIAHDADGHSPVSDWLARHEPARACLAKLYLVPTVAAQIWYRQSPDAIGLRDRTLVTWASPYSVACDMSEIITHEAWPAPRPKACAYLCGAMNLDAPRAPSGDEDAVPRATRQAKRALREQLDAHGATLFSAKPEIHAPDGVHDPLGASYVRANVEPWDLADLAHPGADPVRLEAADTGLDNLALAGTWVRTPVNTTSLEAAVCSGIAAARALGATVRPILAEDLLRQPSRAPHLPGRAPSDTDHDPTTTTARKTPRHDPRRHVG